MLKQNMLLCKMYYKEIKINTLKEVEFLDITEKVKESVKESKIKNGHILIQPMHTTVGIFLNENEKGLLKDLIDYLSEKIPQIKGKYLHDEIEKRICPPDEPLNAHSHIKSALYSNPSLSLILFEGKLKLGKYQRIFFTEFDGPCPRKCKSIRKYLISIIGE